MSCRFVSGLAGAAVIWVACLAPGCSCAGPPVEVRGVARDGRTGKPLAGAKVQAVDADAKASADAEGRFRIVAEQGGAIRVSAPGHCAAEVPIDGKGAVTAHLFPRLELEELYPQVGFDREVAITVKVRCDEAAVVEWKQTSGPPLGERMRAYDGGRKLVVRTHPITDLVELDDRLGVIALSRRERGDYRFEMRVELEGETVVRTVQVTAAAASNGGFQVPTGGAVYLRGVKGKDPAFTLIDVPEQSHAKLVDGGTHTPHFVPDRFGQYLVRYEPEGRIINIQAGAYEEVPRDCGRDGCHKPEADGWEATAHSRTFKRGLEGGLGAEFEEKCWSCHATGVDFGIDNGGLHQVASGIPWQQPEPHEGLWEEAPRQIRRHGSVWCSACHGPGRILPPRFRWEYGAKYQAGVCARCHDVTDDPDANHDSPEYREWTRAPMASFVNALAPNDPARREGCASCHSTQGFIAFIDRAETIVPDPDTVDAIACSTCHDPHSGENPRSLRVFDAVAGLESAPLGKGAICASCHQTEPGALARVMSAPHAPQANVLLGTGAKLVRDKPGPHSALANACVSCHMARPPSGDPLRGRAGGHTFSVRDLDTESGLRAVVSPAACEACHGREVPPSSIGGIRDFAGDGGANDVGEEYRLAFERSRAALRKRISAARVTDGCKEPRVAADYREVDAALLLVDASNVLLGDCDGSGTHEGREKPVGYDALPKRWRDITWDLALLEKDGSKGRHNPALTFAVLSRAAELLK